MLKLNHLTGFGSGAAAAAGDVTSYAFDGTGDCLSIPNHADWDLTDAFTLELFVKHNDHAGDEYYIAGFEGNDDYWHFRHVHGSGLVYGWRVGGEQQELLRVV